MPEVVAEVQPWTPPDEPSPTASPFRLGALEMAVATSVGAELAFRLRDSYRLLFGREAGDDVGLTEREAGAVVAGALAPPAAPIAASMALRSVRVHIGDVWWDLTGPDTAALPGAGWLARTFAEQVEALLCAGARAASGGGADGLAIIVRHSDAGLSAAVDIPFASSPLVSANVCFGPPATEPLVPDLWVSGDALRAAGDMARALEQPGSPLHAARAGRATVVH